jgi:hypothetical protein
MKIYIRHRPQKFWLHGTKIQADKTFVRNMNLVVHRNTLRML